MLRAIAVDDEYIVIKGLENMIDWAGLGIELIGTAGDGHTALEMVRIKQPDIVLSDIRMPGMDGLQLLEIILEELPQTYCIVFSGFNEFDYVKRAIQLGVSDYIEKPITIQSIHAAFQKAKQTIGEQKEATALKRLFGMTGMARIEEIEGSRDTTKNSSIEKARSYIEQNITRDLSLQEVAEHVGMNAAYLSVLFKEVVGESYIKYLTRYRMELAKMLLTKGFKVNEVSEKVGYHTYRHFSEVFKKYSGITPGQFKDQHENLD